jgi:hypothetical protein
MMKNDNDVPGDDDDDWPTPTACCASWAVLHFYDITLAMHDFILTDSSDSALSI